VKTATAMPGGAALLLLAILLAGAVTAEEQVGLGLTVRPTATGLLVTAVESASSAEAGGLRTGDVLVGVGAAHTRTPADFRREVAAHRGVAYGIKVRRDDNVVDVPVPRNPAGTRFHRREAVRRQCASFCLVEETQRWHECGCVVAECIACIACIVQP
jgi:predicted metalloprotease with PDZ domain